MQTRGGRALGGSNASACETPTLVLLGAPAVLLPGGDRVALERHDAALLALLVLDGPQARQDMATLLWPAVAPSKALTSLRQRLFRLRRSAGHALVSEDGALQLAAGVAHDLDPAANLDDLRASPSEFHLLAGHHHPPGEPLAERLQMLRERWQQARAAVMEARADALEASGDLQGALRLALRIRTGQPASERAARRCMHLHYLLGDRGQALAAYARCRDHLREHLGLVPDEQTQRLARLIESSQLPGRPTALGAVATALARPPRLVGRDRIWAQLQTASAMRLPVVLRGEPGIGKTRLVGDFARTQPRAMVVRPSVDMGRVPYAMTTALLTEWRSRWASGDAAGTAAAAELAHIVPPEWCWSGTGAAAPQTRRMARAVGELLAAWAGQAGACLVVDDVQWIDAASLDLLLAWLDGTRGSADAAAVEPGAALAPTVCPPVVLAVRTRSMPSALVQWLQTRAATQSVLDLTLGPLDAPALAALVSSLQAPGEDGTIPGCLSEHAKDPQDLYRKTGGHPYIVLELLRHEVTAGRMPTRAGSRTAAADTAARVDARLRALLLRRIGHLPPAPQRLLQLLSLAGTAVPDEVVRSLSGMDDADLAAAWQVLSGAQLLDEDGRVFDVVAEAMVSDVPVPLARRLHERLAQARAKIGDAAALVATHWQAAGRWPEAGAAWVAAAHAARRQGRPLEALAAWDSAARAFDRAAMPAEQADALIKCLEPAQLVAPSADLMERLDRLDAVALTDAQGLVVALARARALLNSSDGQAALGAAHRAMALARATGDEDAELSASAWLALAQAMAGARDEGLALLETLLPQAERPGALRPRVDFHGARGYALHLAGDYVAALSAMEQAQSLALAIGDIGEALEQTNNRMVCLGSMGRRDEALTTGEQMLGLWRRMGEPDSVNVTSSQVQLAALYAGAGRFSEALDLLQSALAIWQRTGPTAWRIITEHRLARLYLILGQAARAAQVLTPLAGDSDAGRATTRVMVEYRIARLGGLAATTPLADALAQHAPELSAMDRRALMLLLAADAPADRALALAEAVAGEATGEADAPARHHALLRMALAHAALGQGRLAGDLVRQVWTGGPLPPLLDTDHASACWWIHQAAMAAADTALAAAALQEGQRWLEATLPQVPEAFRASYLDQNPVHRALLLARPAMR